ncbi:MAG TPA: slipin family protein [Pseudobdellovibrionaceae bacterium]|nr:slipin family protein [Pseudobdellovibrionaceae bacterium]
MGSLLMFALVFGASLIFSAIKVLSEWEKGVILRLGRSIGARGPGLVFVIPFIDRLYRVDLRTVTMDVPPQDVITQDNISLKVNAVVYFRVTDAEQAISKVTDYLYATSQLAQTTLRSVLGQFQMDEILDQREKINHRLQELIDKQTEPWGVKVSAVEVKNIDLPKEMQSAIARQAEAERERRAKLISAEGELQRAEKLAEASNKLAASPSALQLAYLQTLSEISNNDNTRTIIFPVPIDLLKAMTSNKS